MIISIENLKAGLHWWHTSNFPSDIHNTDYYDIYGIRKVGPTDEWWDATVDRLSQWRAYRGPNPPNTKKEIHLRGKQVLDHIKDQYNKLIQKSYKEPSIADCSWEDVETLFLLSSGIKPKSPVFSSKICHFLFPRLFIIMDNLATSTFDYEFYWRGMKDEWYRLKEKNEAGKILIEAIISEKLLHPLYPLETKIMELSHIGYKHG